MKIAVFHQFMDNIGGAEIVALTLARELGADLYTTNVDFDKIRKMGFENIKIFSLGRIPKNAPLRHQLAFWKFRKLDLGKKYDFYIIAGDWAMSGLVNNKPNLWYVHSPLNELWQFKDYVRNVLLVPWKRPIFDAWVWFNRRLNKKYLKHGQKLACNSENTRCRIERFYDRGARVINPPIETSKFKPGKYGNYWLSVNRLTRAKRIEIQMQAFAKLPNERLIIVGSYERGSALFESYKRFIEKIKPKNVKIMNWVDSETLRDLHANSKGFITTSKDEDFGMNVIEAMASGRAVIAPNEGGYKESIVNGKTGILIDNINSDKLVGAIKKMGKNPGKYKNACIKQARKYDTKEFIRKIKEMIR